MDTYTIPAAPAGWYLDRRPSVGALVVPLGNTEADVIDALARGWQPLLITKLNTSTGRATARTSELQARPVVYSSRGASWGQGGRSVWFATPRYVAPASTPAPAAVLLDEPTEQAAPVADTKLFVPVLHATPRPGLPGWLAEAQRDAARRDRTRELADQAARAAADLADQQATEQAEREADEADERAVAAQLAAHRTTRPAWLYGAAAGTEGAPTAPDTQLADDAPDTTPRPATDVFVRAQLAAARWLREHDGRCVRCAYNPWSRCERGAGLARRAYDAQQAADGAQAVSR